MGYFQEVEIEY